MNTSKGGELYSYEDRIQSIDSGRRRRDVSQRDQDHQRAEYPGGLLFLHLRRLDQPGRLGKCIKKCPGVWS